MGLLGGITDSLFGSGGAQYSDKAAKLYDDIALPDIEQQKLLLQKYVEEGRLSPEQAEAYLVNNNAVDSMDLDSVGKNAQLSALDQLSEIGNEGGLTASDKARLQRIDTDEQTAARGAREAILQNAQARGAGGSGLEMLAQLTNAQDSATRKSQRDLDVAGMAQERALQALQSAGQLGGNINQQQFGQQKSIADSKNEIAKFNAANSQQVGLANTGANNAAQAANLANRQNISNANVDQANKQQQYNKELDQTKFSNEMTKATGQSNAFNQQAAQANAARASDQGLFGTILGAGATIAKSDERAKEDIEPFNAGDFLDSFSGYKYKYKNPADGVEKQVGPMAQDIEKDVPQMVEDTPEGKMVDYSPAKAGGPIFASLADIHKRVRKLEGK
jgi:hypothetical protein